MAFDSLFTPCAVGPIELPNRIVRGPYTTQLGGLVSEIHGKQLSGLVNEDFIAHHEQLAREGVGAIILEVGTVHPSCFESMGVMYDEIVEGYQELMARIRPYGTRVIQQLGHRGRHAHHQLGDGTPSWAPSAIPGRDGAVAETVEETPVAMTPAMIDELVEAFGAAAGRVREGGLDGVEIHAAHGYLAHQFLSVSSNRRDDEYGGSFENRMRFLLRVLEAVRLNAGADLAVGVRISNEDLPWLTNEDMVEVARAIDRSGHADYLHVSAGLKHNLELVVGAAHLPHGYMLPKSTPITAAVGLTTMVVGRILTLQEADDIVSSGQADLVCMVRALLADPQLISKSRAGRLEEIRPCIGCDYQCYGGALRGRRHMGCSINPSVGYERTLDEDLLTRADPPLRVLVAGGGPAGMETARVAALRGHEVTLCDANGRLGGQLSLARRAPYRHELGLFADWLAAECTRLGVDIRLETPVDAELARSIGADIVVNATGSTPRRDGFQVSCGNVPIAGFDEPHVLSSWDVMEGAEVGQSVVLLDDLGQYEAIAVADTILEGGERKVLWVTRFPSIGVHDSPVAAQPARARLGRHGVRIHPYSELRSVSGGRAMIRSLESGVEELAAIETAIIVGVGVADDALQRELAGLGVEVVAVGDARSPSRFLQNAVEQGHFAARTLGVDAQVSLVGAS